MTAEAAPRNLYLWQWRGDARLRTGGRPATARVATFFEEMNRTRSLVVAVCRGPGCARHRLLAARSAGDRGKPAGARRSRLGGLARGGAAGDRRDRRHDRRQHRFPRRGIDQLRGARSPLAAGTDSRALAAQRPAPQRAGERQQSGDARRLHLCRPRSPSRWPPPTYPPMMRTERSG